MCPLRIRKLHTLPVFPRGRSNYEIFVDAPGNSQASLELSKAVFQDTIGSEINRVNTAHISETFLK